MKSSDYVRILSRSWLIIIILLIIGGVGGYWVYHTKPKVYQSTVEMIVSGSGAMPGDEIASRLLASERAVALAQVAGTAPAVQAARRAAGYPNAAVTATATAVINAPLLKVSVAGQSPAEVRAIAGKFASTLPATMVKLEGPSDSAIRISNLAPASLPSKPVSPSLRRDGGFGLLVGLLLGLVIAIGREALDRTLRETADISELTDLTVLGTVPNDLPKKRLPVVSSPRSARAEAYRQVRTTLINNRRTELRTIAITSASLGEGKTSVATNVAAAFSRAGHRVAIIDADLRRPSVATFFGLSPERGLTDVLTGTCSLPEALNVLDDGRLAVLTSGARPANPSEALAGAAMQGVLRQLADEYDYVFVDTPPALPVSDPLVLAPQVDGVILVIQLGRTTRERMHRASNALERVNATILGVVPNMSGKGSDRDYRYPYRYTDRGARKDASVILPIPVGNGRPAGDAHH